MKKIKPKNNFLLLTLLICQIVGFPVLAKADAPKCQLLIAKQFFDGVNFPQTNMAVLVIGNKVRQVGSAEALGSRCKVKINLGDATILPGFIESHASICLV